MKPKKSFKDKLLFTKKTKKQIIILASLSTFSLILFLIFTYIVRADTLRAWDFNLMVRLQDNIPHKLDDLFSILSIIGRFEYTFTLLLLILLLNRKILGALAAVFFFGTAHVIEVIGKLFLNQPGPPHMFLRTHFTDFPGLYVHTNASYPSGHSLRIIFIAITVMYLVLKSKKLPNFGKIGATFFSLIIVLLMLLSRVSLGEHWTTDVIGGALLGTATSLATLIFL